MIWRTSIWKSRLPFGGIPHSGKPPAPYPSFAGIKSFRICRNDTQRKWESLRTKGEHSLHVRYILGSASALKPSKAVVKRLLKPCTAIVKPSKAAFEKYVPRLSACRDTPDRKMGLKRRDGGRKGKVSACVGILYGYTC